jgi:hypothetical protein
MSQFAIGKYEREALEHRRRELLEKRRYGYGGLSADEGRELDGLEEKLGPATVAPSPLQDTEVSNTGGGSAKERT